MDKPEVKDVSALVPLAMQKIQYLFHNFEGTKFMICAGITPRGMVLCTGYAQRFEGEFVVDVAREYSLQNCKQGVEAQLSESDSTLLMQVINGDI